ncbi:MAG: helix-turn-helix domain-containing protein [Rhodospirillaceae bacterium]
MSLSTSNLDSLYIPSEDEAAEASNVSRQMARFFDGTQPVKIRIGESSQSIDLPNHIARLLREILEQAAQGHAVTIVPLHAELTSQQAADLLAVSRAHLVKLLDEGRIEHRKVGRHRRVLAKDLLQYRDEMTRERKAILDDLTELDQSLGLQ